MVCRLASPCSRGLRCLFHSSLYICHRRVQQSCSTQPIQSNEKTNVLTSFRGYVVNNLYVSGSKPADPTYVSSTWSGSVARKRRFSTRPSGHRIRNKATGSVHVASGSSGSRFANDKRIAYKHDNCVNHLTLRILWSMMHNPWGQFPEQQIMWLLWLLHVTLAKVTILTNA